MFIEAYQDPAFQEITNSAEVVTPDGRPLLWGLKILKGINQNRVAGMDLLPDLLQEMEFKNITAFFYGGTQEMLDTTSIYIKTTYPKLKIAGLHSPPFDGKEDSSLNEIINKINNSFPCIVFVVLGCPKQEKWMNSMKDKIHTVMIGIGGALPVTIGMQKRAPLWMQNRGLEWLFRLSLEPDRLFKRYFITNSLFLWIFLKEFLRIKIGVPLGLSKAIK
ncbi:MAG: WecB/TagA/CpsF family glycosyltransferase [Bacteroidota bacterium]|nr:WecB/TagA/CpsF family glycosyltransferase [Bacteroidota bacterium]